MTPHEHLEILRKEVDECDRMLVQAFCRRMDLNEQIGHIKAAAGIPVFDDERERQVIANAVALGSGHPGETLSFIRDVITLSKGKQKS
ncbi:MAG: chorismate mutase [Oscillospiraceae bacterium]|jgi:chorismate mutase|nr:chorismate mutase [Oscillospiraceae bacterium]